MMLASDATASWPTCCVNRRPSALPHNAASARSRLPPPHRAIVAFLNSSATRKALGTDALPATYTLISAAVHAAFDSTGDQLRDAAPHVGQLLDRGVRVLVFAGAYDLVCNWVGNERMTRALAWHGQDAFGAEALHEWEVDGEKVGKARSWGSLTFASVYAAGHMVSGWLYKRAIWIRKLTGGVAFRCPMTSRRRR